MKKKSASPLFSLIFLLITFSPLQWLYAQQPFTGEDHWDNRFGKPGIEGMIKDIAEDSKGNIYFVGEFRVANDGSANLSVRNIVIWDGEAFHSPGGGINSYINAIAIDDDDNVYVGGSFSTAYQTDGSTLSTRNIAMWDGTGWRSLGVQGSPNNGIDRGVDALHILDGILYVGGNFTTARQPDGTTIPAANIASWDDTKWSALDSGTDHQVMCLASQNGILFAGGRFEKAGDASAISIATWNGSEWSALPASLSPGTLLNAMVFGPDGHLYAGGHFALLDGRFVNHIARWDGEKWEGLDRGLRTNMATIYSLDADDTYIYAGGTLFPTIGELTVNQIARWNGTVWSAMCSGIHTGRVMGTGLVNAVKVIRDHVYVGGYYSLAGDISANNISRWDGSRWKPVGSGSNQGFDNVVYAIGIASHGIYAGGVFASAGPKSISRLARWDGKEWHEVGGAINSQVSAIAVHNDFVYAGGAFWLAGDLEVNRIAMWDGHSWHALGGGVNSSVSAIAVDDDNNVYVGGAFSEATNADGTSIPVNHIAKWDGTEWHALDSGTDAQVRALAVTGDKVYAGGMFRQASGKTVNYVAEWDGAEWHDLDGGVNIQVNALAADGSGNVYAGGAFTEAGGTTILKVARWDGSEWHALDGGIDGVMVNTLAVDDNVLYAGGWFENAGRIIANHIAKWENGKWEPLHQGAWAPGDAQKVYAIAVKEGIVFAGGAFLQAGGSPSYFFAEWSEGESWAIDTSGERDEIFETVELPPDYVLYQNYPNPFNAATVIRYRLPEASFVRLEIFNMLGQRVARLQEETVHSGRHEVIFVASHLPSGVYVYRLQAGGFVMSRKLLLLQ